MHAEIFDHGSSARRIKVRRKPLVARGGIARTFGSLVTFLALLFLSTGIYLLNEAFANPVAAQAAALIAAGFVIALATILLYYLISPRQKTLRTRVDRRSTPALSSEMPTSSPPSEFERLAFLPHGERRHTPDRRVRLNHSRAPR